jgi:hypothetical protein
MIRHQLVARSNGVSNSPELRNGEAAIVAIGTGTGNISFAILRQVHRNDLGAVAGAYSRVAAGERTSQDACNGNSLAVRCAGWTSLDELIVPVRERIQLSVLHVSPRKSTARRAVGRHHCARTGVSRIRVVIRIRRDHNDPGHVSREC